MKRSETNTYSSTTAASSLSSSTIDSDMITIIGFGSLLSEKSSRLTFPNLQNFRLARVPNYRRVFGHPTSIFFRRGIANMETLEMSSLAVEYVEGFPGFVGSVFEVPNDDMMEDGIPSAAFLEREEEFNIIAAPYQLVGDVDNSITNSGDESKGIICTRSSDEEYIRRWGQERFQKYYGQYGITTIWGWKETSGLRPCAIYLRHCYLAAKGLGEVCFNSFLDETFLVDRRTTIREYLRRFPDVLDVQPPRDLVDRYSG